MVDYTKSGKRCKTLVFLRTARGNLDRDEQGTILHEVESLGKWQVVVEWDRGVTVPVFPEEIELVAKEERIYVVG